jgi:hypothetical protein
MKKVLLALTMVALIATSASALSVLGGRIGIGAEEIGTDITNNNGAGGAYPFISWDPEGMPALQMRLGFNSWQDKVSGADPDKDSYSEVSLAGIYRLGSGDIVPTVGLKIGVENQYWAVNPWDPAGWVNDNTVSATLMLGAEWKVLKQISLLANWNALVLSTTNRTWGEPYNMSELTYANQGIMDHFVRLGAVLYL